MDQFSYLSVLLSIIIALGISQLLSGFGRLIQERGRVLTYWPSIAWAGFLLVIDIQTWWSMSGLRTHHDWNFFGFLILLLQPIVLYLLAVLVLPDFAGDEIVDLRANYYSHNGWFFGLGALLPAVSIMKDVVIYGSLPERLNLSVQVIFLVALVPATLTRREWYHKLLVVPVMFGLVAYIAILFARLQ